MCAVGPGVDAASSSRCDRTETYSPAPIDSAPASSPASPVSSTAWVDTPPPLTPEHQREVADQAVVGAEHRRPEGAGDPGPAAGGQAADDLLVHPLVGRHRPGGVDVGVVRRPGLGPLGQCEHEHRAEVPGQPGQHPHPDVTARSAGPMSSPSRLRPVRGVPLLGLGEFQQDLPFLAGPPAGQIAVDLGFLPLVGEPATPFAKGSRGGGR